jgi:hypothetical protein
MFTTGSKLFYGLGSGATVAAIAYGIETDWGAIGVMGLVSAAVVLFFLGGLVAVLRDADVLRLDPALREGTAAAQRSAGGSIWPMAAVVGAAVVGVGLVTEQRVFVVGVVVLVVALVEWMITAWAERASADGSYNRRVGKRFLDPLEHPIFAVVGLGIIVFFFSRVMLALSSTSGAVVFVVVAALILAFGALLGLRRQVSKGVVGGIIAVGFIALGAAGIAAAVQGERDELAEEHPARECGPDESEWDRSSLDHVSAKTGELATVYFQDGQVWAEIPGLDGQLSEITVQRSAQSVILFVNKDAQERRLVATLGADADPAETCTQLTGEDQTQFLTLKYDTPSDPADPYLLFVAGAQGSSVEVLVP